MSGQLEPHQISHPSQDVVIDISWCYGAVQSFILSLIHLHHVVQYSTKFSGAQNIHYQLIYRKTFIWSRGVIKSSNQKMAR